jgi:hypothetical protein
LGRTLIIRPEVESGVGRNHAPARLLTTKACPTFQSAWVGCGLAVAMGVADGTGVGVKVGVAVGDGTAVSTKLTTVTAAVLGGSVTMLEAVLATEQAASVMSRSGHNTRPHSRYNPVKN